MKINPKGSRYGCLCLFPPHPNATRPTHSSRQHHPRHPPRPNTTRTHPQQPPTPPQNHPQRRPICAAWTDSVRAPCALPYLRRAPLRAVEYRRHCRRWSRLPCGRASIPAANSGDMDVKGHYRLALPYAVAIGGYSPLSPLCASIHIYPRPFYTYCGNGCALIIPALDAPSGS